MHHKPLFIFQHLSFMFTLLPGPSLLDVIFTHTNFIETLNWTNKGHGACSPCGSTSFASLRASELARSVLAGVTARIRQLSLVMNCMIMSLICCSMSAGWSPTGTLVIPGRSMRVRFSTAQSEEWRINVRLNNPAR